MSKTTTRKLRPPVKRHGGKNYLCKRIVELMPEHRTYLEPYIGGGSVLLNKPKAEREIAGDLDAGLINLWVVLKDQTEGLMNWVRGIEYEEDQFVRAGKYPNHGVELIRAVNYLVRNRFSRGGLGKTFAWSDRLRGGQPGDANAWDTIRAELPAIAERVKDVEFHCVDALTLIREHDGPDTLTYCGPPYCHATRTAKAAYDHEMTDAQHAELLDVLCRCEGAVMLSGYANPMYDDALKGWERRTWDLPNHSSQGKQKQRRTEVLWIKKGAVHAHD